MPDLDSLHFDLGGRELVQESARHRMWRDAAGVFLKADVNPAAANWAFDLRDPDAARAFYAPPVPRAVQGRDAGDGRARRRRRTTSRRSRSPARRRCSG